MKFICDGLDLTDAALTVSRALPAKTTNPILEGIKIIAKDDKVTLISTDLELMIEKTIKADVKVGGVIIVPGKFFTDYVKKLSNEQITLESVNDAQCKINYTDNVGYIQLLNSSEYPDIKKVDNDNYFEINKQDLKETITKTIFAVAVDDSRPILKGCFFEILKGDLTVVALDGYRLALTKAKLINSTQDLSFVVPSKTLSEINKILDEVDGNIKLYYQKQYIMLEIDGTIIISRLLDGEYLNYRQVINNNFESQVTVNKRQMEDALERTSLLARVEKNNLAKFDIKEHNLEITSNSEIGNIHENVTISLKGGDILTAFNARYFVDALHAIDDEFITLNFTNNILPCVIKPVEGEKYLFLVLPVRAMN